MDLAKQVSCIEIQDNSQLLEKQEPRFPFLRMVYGCLTPMLLADALCIAATAFVPAAQYFVEHNLLALPVAASAFACLFAVLASWERARRRPPCAFFLLVALTLSAGYVLSAAAVWASPEDLLRAATCTCGVIMIVSLVALFFPCDFTSDVSFLFIEGFSVIFGIVILVGGSIVILGEKNKLLEMGLLSSITVLFAIYLLHDMQLATGTGGLQLPPEECAAGGAFLWVDITSIFLFTVVILANEGSS